MELNQNKSTKTYTRQTRNFIAFMLESIFLATAFSFMNIYIVLPSFAENLTNKAILVGLVTTIMELSLNLPQVFTGNLVAGYKRKKPIILISGFLGRPAFLLLALVIAITDGQPTWLSLITLYVSLILFFGADSIIYVALMDILKRSFPRKKRGGYMSIWRIAADVAKLGAALVVSRIFANQALKFPDNYQILFTFGGSILAISLLSLLLIHENPEDNEPKETQIPWNEFLSGMIKLWKENIQLRRITLVRLFSWFTVMAVPFYVVYATNQLEMPQAFLGSFILTQSISAPLLSPLVGHLINKRGGRWVSQLGALINLIAPITALIFSIGHFTERNLPHRLFLIIYICIGQLSNIEIANTNFVFDIAPKGQTSIYYGFFNSISSIGLVAPLLAGWIIEISSFQILFVTALLFGILSLIFAVGIKEVNPPPSKI